MDENVSRENVEEFDEYGFAIFKKESCCSNTDERCHNYCFVNKNLQEAKLIWEKILKKWNYYYCKGIGSKVYNCLKRGIPMELRPVIWQKLLNISAQKCNSNFDYEEGSAMVREDLMQLGITEFGIAKALKVLQTTTAVTSSGLGRNPNVQEIRQILIDVARTFPTHMMFYGDSPTAVEGRASLFRVLAVYMKYNPDIGYCQGMSYIAGMLLITLPDEEAAFWCFVTLMSRPKYLNGYFDFSLDKVKNHAAIFNRLLKQRQGPLWKHLKNHNVEPLVYVTQWLMCLFTSLPCWDTVLSIWDLMLFEGVCAVFRSALAIMESNSETLLELKDINEIIPVLQRLPPQSLQRGTFFPIVWRTSVGIWELQTIQAELAEEAIYNEMKENTKNKSKLRLHLTQNMGNASRQNILKNNGTSSDYGYVNEKNGLNDTPVSLPVTLTTLPKEKSASSNTIVRKLTNLFHPKLKKNPNVTAIHYIPKNKQPSYPIPSIIVTNSDEPINEQLGETKIESQDASYSTPKKLMDDRNRKKKNKRKNKHVFLSDDKENLPPGGGGRQQQNLRLDKSPKIGGRSSPRRCRKMNYSPLQQNRSFCEFHNPTPFRTESQPKTSSIQKLNIPGGSMTSLLSISPELEMKPLNATFAESTSLNTLDFSNEETWQSPWFKKAYYEKAFVF